MKEKEREKEKMQMFRLTDKGGREEEAAEGFTDCHDDDVSNYLTTTKERERGKETTTKRNLTHLGLKKWETNWKKDESERCVVAERCCSAGARESSYPATDGGAHESGRWYGLWTLLGEKGEEKERERKTRNEEKKKESPLRKFQWWVETGRRAELVAPVGRFFFFFFSFLLHLIAFRRTGGQLSIAKEVLARAKAN